MAKESEGQEKSEQPTGKKVSDSREKGQVAKSMEINSLAIFGSGLILLFMYKNFIGGKLSGLAEYIFSSLDTLDITLSLSQMYIEKGFAYILVTLAPFFIGLVLVALATGYGQTGFMITPKALAPKLDRFNPISGMKNKFFSTQPLVEMIKSVFKVIVIGAFAYWELQDAVVNSLGLVNYTVSEIVLFMIDTALNFLWKVALIYLVLAIADFIYQRRKHTSDLMMTKQEVKEESKQTEGDPQLKGHIKGKQLAMARNRMMKEVPKADVVITNPTHYAVALKYNVGNNGAPKVIAKGVDAVAQRIKKLAVENNVPLHEDRQLARALYKICNIGDEIPENLYQAVAQILAYVFKQKRAKKKSIV
ncbi:MAG: flagellar biosynthesis protein FlhB [Melioribacteraceae bacterium]|nr:flagellar biosynthesis protein FlhB [Melioribacteraceae bacterium]